MIATGGVHEREEATEAMIGEAQARGGSAFVARRGSGCAEPGDGPAGGGVVGLAG